MIAEGSYHYNQDGQLPGTIKIGGWNQSGTLHNQPFGQGPDYRPDIQFGAY